jgi:hypothetical protein
MIAPHRSNRKRLTQDGRLLRYRRRWKIDCCLRGSKIFAGGSRVRLFLDNFTIMVHLACA